MRIIGPPSITYQHLLTALRGIVTVHPRLHEEMLDPLWSAAVDYMIDPLGVVAQAYKETGGGNFSGKVKPAFYNTCGLKIRHQGLFPGITDNDNPLAHQMFPSWEIGARAHVQHLRAYAGWPVPDDIVDPRYTFVVGKYNLEHFEDLGGRWAPAVDYGFLVVKKAWEIRG